MMRTLARAVGALVLCSLALPAGGRDYLAPVRKFADVLLENGRDTYGPRKTALWCGVIDVDELAVPRATDKVPATPGVRAGDRAVGGCNLYHDGVTLRTFAALSRVTGDARYDAAAREYVRDYLALCRGPQTGLIAWGEHLYYDVHIDAVDEKRASHELIEWTAPWELLWEVDAKATAGAIAGIQYHFRGADPAAAGWLFNRHATWAKAEYQKAGQPWIKHTGLYAHAFAVLYAKTGEEKWLRWAEGAGSLYWEHRNPKTDLAEGCLGDPRPESRHATLEGTSELCYWNLKAHHAARAAAAPRDTVLRERALTMLKAVAKHTWDDGTKSYRESVNTDGTPVAGAKAGASNPWVFAYGSGGSGLLRFGRIAAYVAATEKDAQCLEMARRAHAAVAAFPVPEKFTPEEIGFAIALSLDVYDLTNEPACLEQAKRYADLALDKLVAPSGLFRRLPGDRYYEAKLGAGDLAAALLRLHLRVNPEAKDVGAHDWSF